FLRKCRNKSFADRDEAPAGAFDADALATDTGAFEQQPQAVGEQIGFDDPGLAAKLRQSITLFDLEFFNKVPRRMIAFSKFDCCVGDIAAAAVVARAFGAATDPGMKLCQRVTGMVGFKSVPDLVCLLGGIAKAGNHQIVLRAEVTIQRHLVGARYL